MNTLHVYHISQIDLGDYCEFKPDIPKFKSHFEDKSIRRICACTSITDCIVAINNIPYTAQFAPDGLDLWLYESDICIEDIIQPTDTQVEDAWYTGELWITKPYVFKKTAYYKCRKHMEFPNMPYSRYSFTRVDKDEVVDRIYTENIYGDRDSFSMLLLDPEKEENPSIYYNKENEECLNFM